MAQSERWSALTFRASIGKFLSPPDSDKIDLGAVTDDQRAVSVNSSEPDSIDAPVPSLISIRPPENEFLLAVILPGIPIYGRGMMRKLRP